MKRLVTLSRTLLTAAALTVVASSAHAAGVNLSWNDCASFGQQQRNFACASNSGANTMVGSAITGVAMPQLNGMAGVLDMQTNEAALSPWWTIGGAPNCRLTSTVSADFNFLALANCVDPWAGVAAGGSSYIGPFGPANRARFRTVCAIPGNTAITGTDEYYFFKITFTNARSTGNGSCAGCADGACILLNSLQVTQPAGVGDYVITNALVQSYVLWQAGGSAIGGLGCPLQVPTRNQTWGSVKSLYR